MPDGTSVLTAVADADYQNTRGYYYRVVSVDPETCEVVDEFYTVVTAGSIGEPDLSPSGLLAFTASMRERQTFRLETGEEVLVTEGGLNPDWLQIAGEN